MFQFTDLDTLSRSTILLKQMEAVREYQKIKALERLWDAFGDNARKLIDYYQPHKTQVEFLPEMLKMFNSGRKRQEKVRQYLEKLDLYLRDIDTRLADGTKWYNALDIQKMFEETQSPDQ